MALLIRPATSLDLDPLVPLVAGCFEPAWSRSAIEGALCSREARAFVAASDSGLVGFVLARRILDGVEIDLVGVARSARRQGVAARLLATLIEVERETGARQAQLELSSANPAAAALYAALGFVVVGRRPRYYPDGHDALLLSRTLG